MLGLELFPLGTAIVLCVFALLWLAVAVVVQRQSNAVDDGATGYTLISEPPTDHIDGHRGGPGVANTLREPLLRDDDEPPAAPPAIERQFTFSPKHAGGAPRYLVCTDRASRGMDFPDIRHVVLYDFPRDGVEYLRRG